MRRFVTILVVSSIALYTIVAEAQRVRTTTNKGGGFACFTKADADEFTRAQIHAQDTKDTSWALSLISSQRCFSMKKGLRVTIKNFEILGLSEIYLHPPGGGAPVAVWTANENFLE